MKLIVLPGIHSVELTTGFIQGLEEKVQLDYLIFPADQEQPYSAIAVIQWLEQQRLSKLEPLAFLAFSAGVVGGFAAAVAWQLQGGNIQRFIAFDGWGMPLVANFPISRVSHDFFTHWSSSLLGSGDLNFYADPAVAHLALWRSPQTCCGWQQITPGMKSRCELLGFIEQLLSLDLDRST